VLKGWKPKIQREGLLFISGMAGFWHEVVIWKGPDRPFIIGACLGMMGLTAFIGWDEKKKPPPAPPPETPAPEPEVVT
jgi:hypothetical protein